MQCNKTRKGIRDECRHPVLSRLKMPRKKIYAKENSMSMTNRYTTTVTRWATKKRKETGCDNWLTKKMERDGMVKAQGRTAKRRRRCINDDRYRDRRECEWKKKQVQVKRSSERRDEVNIEVLPWLCCKPGVGLAYFISKKTYSTTRKDRAMTEILENV